MLRTQVYLTEGERKGLSSVSKATGRRQSELIREAVDKFLALTEGDQKETVLSEAAGMWRQRRDLPDYASRRRSWESR